MERERILEVRFVSKESVLAYSLTYSLFLLVVLGHFLDWSFYTLVLRLFQLVCLSFQKKKAKRLLSKY